MSGPEDVLFSAAVKAEQERLGSRAKFTDRDGRVAKLAKAKLTDEQLVEEAFLATLSRFPTAARN